MDQRDCRRMVHDRIDPREPRLPRAISKARKRRAIQEILPSIATMLLAFVLHQELDYVWGLLSVTILFGRLVDLYSQPTPKRLSRRRVGRSGPSHPGTRTRSRGGL